MVFVTARVPEETAMTFQNGEAQVRNVEVRAHHSLGNIWRVDESISLQILVAGGRMFCSRRYSRRAQEARKH